jgi:hypothetical protein
MQLKTFKEFINESENQNIDDSIQSLKRMVDLGVIDQAELVKFIKSKKSDIWVSSLLKELDELHQKDPQNWGKPSHTTSPYNTIEFNINTDMVSMPDNHYNNYEYKLLYTEPVTVVVYLGGDSSLELRASYDNSEFEEAYGEFEEAYGEDEDDEDDEDNGNQYDAVWSYYGNVSILTVEDILTIIDQFNDEADENTLENSSDWMHD